MSGYLGSSAEVIRGLITYTDWWQPASTSILQVGPARRTKDWPDGIPPGLLSTLDERTELCRRMRQVSDLDRRLLFLWYVQQLPVEDITRMLRISRRQCFRRRGAAIHTIVKLGEPDQAA